MDHTRLNEKQQQQSFRTVKKKTHLQEKKISKLLLNYMSLHLGIDLPIWPNFKERTVTFNLSNFVL